MIADSAKTSIMPNFSATCCNFLCDSKKRIQVGKKDFALMKENLKFAPLYHKDEKKFSAVTAGGLFWVLMRSLQNKVQVD